MGRCRRFELLIATCASAYGQTYPAKPVRVIVPFAPGGGSDHRNAAMNTILQQSDMKKNLPITGGGSLS